MDSKLFLLLSVALLSVTSDGSPTNLPTESEHWFYTGFLEVRDISHSIKEIFENYVSVAKYIV